MPSGTAQINGSAHGDKDQIQEGFDAFVAGLNASNIVPDFSLSFIQTDPDPFFGLIATPDGYGNVILSIPTFEALTGCTYKLQQSDNGFSNCMSPDNVSSGEEKTLSYQSGRQWRVDIVGSNFTVEGEPTSPLA